MSMTVQFSGGTPRYQFQWLAAVNKWADTVGPIGRAALKQRAPVASGPNAVRPGRLRDSIRYARINTPGTATLQFIAYVPYAGYVIGGTRAHRIYPVAARYLHFFNPAGDGNANGKTETFVGPRGDITAYVSHPGTKANPFNQKAMEEVKPQIQQLFTDIMTEALGGGE